VSRKGKFACYSPLPSIFHKNPETRFDMKKRKVGKDRLDTDALYPYEPRNTFLCMMSIDDLPVYYSREQNIDLYSCDNSMKRALQ
jgi:hypothetical protein